MEGAASLISIGAPTITNRAKLKFRIEMGFGGSLGCTRLVGWGHPLAKSDEAARFYRRAEELRNTAADTQPQEARRTLLKLAEDYELMDNRAELAKPRN